MLWYLCHDLYTVQGAWRRVVSQAVLLGVPTPCFSTALAFYDGYRSEMLPANLIQVPNLVYI
jgi:6-phosphogluconate dehydrogenase